MLIVLGWKLDLIMAAEGGASEAWWGFWEGVIEKHTKREMHKGGELFWLLCF